MNMNGTTENSAKEEKFNDELQKALKQAMTQKPAEEKSAQAPVAPAANAAEKAEQEKKQADEVKAAAEKAKAEAKAAKEKAAAEAKAAKEKAAAEAKAAKEKAAAEAKAAKEKAAAEKAKAEAKEAKQAKAAEKAPKAPKSTEKKIKMPAFKLPKPKKVEDERQSREKVFSDAFIEFKDVRKTYIMGETEIHALDGIDFKIQKGEMVIVVGASGAGKSTILNILGGMDSLTSGTVIVDGDEVSAYDDNDLIFYRRYDVGFVFQFYNLVQNLTARENVELATQVSKDPLDVQETMVAVGLESRENNFPSQLSGGEQQRVAIARALAKNPKLLLCDEPTGALDYNTGKSILKLLQDTARKSGMTVIIITHNYALTSIGDRVIKVKNGRIEAVETNDHPMDIKDVEW